MPFGVNLPDNLGSEPAPSAEPTSTEPVSSPEASKTEAPPGSAPPSLTDLDKLERFRFAGREWTPKELKSAHLMHSDYTKKTQELAETRKYADNFAADLQTVLSDRARLEEFRRIYPKEFVAVAERILAGQPGQPNASPAQPTSTDPLKDHPEFLRMRGELNEWKQEKEKAEIAANQSWLDNQFATLSKRYPFADHEVVTARAEVAMRNGTQLKPDDAGQSVLEKLFKQNDAEVKARWEKHYKEKVNQQLEAGKRGRDVGSGGGTPTGAPKGFKTIKEATAAFLNDIQASR